MPLAGRRGDTRLPGEMLQNMPMSLAWIDFPSAPPVMCRTEHIDRGLRKALPRDFRAAVASAA
ncbi:hypothetical protein GCM10010341_90490 [Streptomyces noursei]|nr:hypothetical protein GCM10010341_90490 [Streptomyces noursei]